MSHPLARKARLRTISNIARWQIKSRLYSDAVVIPWIDGANLTAKSGMVGATGNLYFGLHEFADMAFLLHFLRSDDLFVDVGANVGTYTVLASGARQANSICFEPDPDTLLWLKKNIQNNKMGDRVDVISKAVGSQPGTVQFSVGLDAINHVIDEKAPEEGSGRSMTVTTLDTELRNVHPNIIKIDVEGYESEVVKGAQETFAKPSLRAIELETVDNDLITNLQNHGFKEYFYDPFSRTLRDRPGEIISHNSLFVRDLDFVIDRLKNAPLINAMGQSF
ncbi:FkbM family methyltransferase [Parasphingorhabdus sp.]